MKHNLFRSNLGLEESAGLTRRQVLGALAGAALAVTTWAGFETAAYARVNDSVYAQCGKACADCHDACQACAKHCQAMIKAGMKEHVRSERLSADCADLCAVAAKLCARKGPMAVAACEATLKAAKACGAECRKYPKMPIMMACAKSCDVCAAACKQMIAA